MKKVWRNTVKPILVAIVTVMAAYNLAAGAQNLAHIDVFATGQVLLSTVILKAVYVANIAPYAERRNK